MFQNLHSNTIITQSIFITIFFNIAFEEKELGKSDNALSLIISKIQLLYFLNNLVF